METLQTNILLFLNQNHILFLDKLSELVSSMVFLAVLWFVVFLLVFLYDEKRGKYVIFAASLAFLIHLLITELFFKHFFFYARPYVVLNAITALGRQFRDSSFPSGHMASTVALSYVLVSYKRKYLVPTTIFAILMAFSRMYNGLHWPLDILGGILFGLFYGYLAVKVTEFALKIKFSKYGILKKLERKNVQKP